MLTGAIGVRLSEFLEIEDLLKSILYHENITSLKIL